MRKPPKARAEPKKPKTGRREPCSVFYHEVARSFFTKWHKGLLAAKTAEAAEGCAELHKGLPAAETAEAAEGCAELHEGLPAAKTAEAMRRRRPLRTSAHSSACSAVRRRRRAFVLLSATYFELLCGKKPRNAAPAV